MPKMRILSTDERGLLLDMYVGKRIQLDLMENDPDPILPGTIGTCRFVDAVGSLIMAWDNRRDLNLLTGVDKFHIVQ